MSRPPLILWQDHIAGLAYSRSAPFDNPLHADRLQAFCTAFSHTGRGMTGADCWVPPSLLERVSRRTAYRYLQVLVDVGLVRQTSAAAPGRSARYQLLVPNDACQSPKATWHASTGRELARVRAQRQRRRPTAARTTRATVVRAGVTGGRPPRALTLRIAA